MWRTTYDGGPLLKVAASTWLDNHVSSWFHVASSSWLLIVRVSSCCFAWGQTLWRRVFLLREEVQKTCISKHVDATMCLYAIVQCVLKALPLCVIWLKAWGHMQSNHVEKSIYRLDWKHVENTMQTMWKTAYADMIFSMWTIPCKQCGEQHVETWY